MSCFQKTQWSLTTVKAVAQEEAQDLVDLPDAIEDSEASKPFRLAMMDLRMAEFFITRAISRTH